jgi:hypothetical protein
MACCGGDGARVSGGDSWCSAMPISPYLDGFPFDAEAKRVMGIAFEMTCVALRVDRTDPIAEKAAKRIIELAKEGERNPDRLCDAALSAARRPPPPAQ